MLLVTVVLYCPIFTVMTVPGFPACENEIPLSRLMNNEVELMLTFNGAISASNSSFLITGLTSVLLDEIDITYMLIVALAMR